MLKKDLPNTQHNSNILKSVADFLNAIQWIPKKYGKWEINNDQIHFKSVGNLPSEIERSLFSGLIQAITQYCEERFMNKNYTLAYIKLFADNQLIKRNHSDSNQSSHSFHNTATYSINLTPAFIDMVEFLRLTNNVRRYRHDHFLNIDIELHSFHKSIVDLVIDDVIDDISTHCFSNKELSHCKREELIQAIKILDEMIFTENTAANPHRIFATNVNLTEAQKQALIKTINHCRKVLTHPAPQNRANGDRLALIGSGDVYTDTGALPNTPEINNGIYNGQVYFWEHDDNGDKEPNSEPVGLFALTAKKASPEPTSAMVHSYFR